MPPIVQATLPPANSFISAAIPPCRCAARCPSCAASLSKAEIELLYKANGHGTKLLATRAVGERLSLLGPIGHPFTLHPDKPIRILIGGGVGIPPMIFIAETIARHHPQQANTTFVFMGSESPFPFDLAKSQYPIAHIAADINRGSADIENLAIASRLASQQAMPGCHQGTVTELAECFMRGLDRQQISRTALFACGPPPMLRAVKQLASQYQLPCQISLEEYMACAVGGCAGCVVAVATANGMAMQRVCVDGPVFDAAAVMF